MIFKALADFYEVLAAQGRVEREGWTGKPVHQEICLDKVGNLLQVVDLRAADAKGKLRPRKMALPDWGSAAGSAIRAQFLCNNSGYVFGLSDKNASPDRLSKMVENCRDLHKRLLGDLHLPETDAVLAFMDFVCGGGELPGDVLDGFDKTALVSDNFVFSVDGVRLHEIPEVQAAWDAEYAASAGGAVGRCLVTGEVGPIADKHPFVKGLFGAQGGGAGLSNYNCDSFCSYGKEQNFNAPVGRHIAYAYTTALSYLLSDPLYHRAFGENLTVVWWPEDADDAYAEFCCASAFGENARWSDSDVAGILDALSRGRPVSGLDPNRKFYVLGLSPNSSRIIVRFFHAGSFGDMISNVRAHYERLEIVQRKGAEGRVLTVNKFLRAMVRDDVNKEIPGVVVDGIFQSILFGRPYPPRVINMVSRRIRSGDEFNWKRAAVIKAYYLRLLENDDRKEYFTVSLNPDNRNPGYLLGRLMALYEFIQYRANGSETIHASYSAASSTPFLVFPRLGRMSQFHLDTIKRKAGKAGKGVRAWFDKQVQDVKGMLGDEYPVRLDLVEQGAFDLGYYHQRQALFTKKGADAVPDGEPEPEDGFEDAEEFES